MVVNGAGRETQFWGALQHCTLGLRVGHRLMIKESERLCVRERKIWGIGGVCVGFEDSRVSPKVDMIPYLLLVEHGLPYSIFILVFLFFLFFSFHDPLLLEH